MTSLRRIRPVILSGGAGTRLWPLSRESRPKQMHSLAGEESLLQMAVRRVADPSTFLPPLIIANVRQADAIDSQLREAGLPEAKLILEPCPRNTAPAIALAAVISDPDELLLMAPSDHLIQDGAGFVEHVRAGIEAADDGWLVTFGIKPLHAETGYGYIRRGEALTTGVYRADAFVEKPDLETATSYLHHGGYSWNAGIFLFRVDELLGAFTAHAPDIVEQVRKALAQVPVSGRRLYPDPDAFAAVRAQSIDHAIMEHAQRVAVVPVEIGWSDVGSWDALYEIGDKNERGNVVLGNAIEVDARHCFLRSDGPMVAAVGVTNLTVIATRDAVLVVPRGDAQRVRELVEQLKSCSVQDLLL